MFNEFTKVEVFILMYFYNFLNNECPFPFADDFPFLLRRGRNGNWTFVTELSKRRLIPRNVTKVFKERCTGVYVNCEDCGNKNVLDILIV